ncbi:hypothetical protein AXG93_2415s1370 [Marchantia polymorpha subsp. ruderalis]|uniref:Uncharacterized protein n=1 Tax=Marchantia polymorpha subsp. ruderalis TaxID=1480154 RepID=A0A176VUX2_MARPO|nr:hypothetical protein AXG93_2415s1370 [Marchantia polymorpha subsp. ruderalis]
MAVNGAAVGHDGGGAENLLEDRRSSTELGRHWREEGEDDEARSVLNFVFVVSSPVHTGLVIGAWTRMHANSGASLA